MGGFWVERHYITALSPRDVHLRVKLANGTFRHNTFQLRQPSTGGRNSWRPTAHGEVVGLGNGSYIRVEYRVHVLVFLFTLVHGLAFFGLTWLIGYFAYKHAISGVESTVLTELDISHDAEEAIARLAEFEPSDPAEPGAASRAPIALRAAADMKGARFSHGCIVGVTQAALTWSGREIPWTEIDGFASEGTILTATLSSGETLTAIGTKTISPNDTDWLTAFLNARLQTWGGEEVRALAEQHRRQLAQLNPSSKG